MKILIANPPYIKKNNNGTERYLIRAGSRWPFFITKKRQHKPDYLPFPFYLAYTVALLESNDKVDLCVQDSIAQNHTKSDFINSIKQIKPNVILFEITTASHDYDISLCKLIKSILPQCIICLAGFHATALSSQIISQHHQFVNYVFLREYEINFSKFINKITNNQSPNNTKGIVFYKQNKTITNPNNFLTDINKLPFPSRHLFPSNNSSNHNPYWDGFCQLKPAIQMHASRGCPFKCNFCAWNQIIYQNGLYRHRSYESICDEMELVKKQYNAKEIYFDDDTFTGDQKSTDMLCLTIIKRGLHKKLSWSAMADFMITNRHTIKLMGKAGCIGLKFGVESGNTEILNNIPKPINFKKIQENLATCHSLSIKTHATYTFGLVGDTKATLNQTLEVAKHLDTDSVQFSITTPFPGTRMYDELDKNNQLTTRDFKKFDGNNTSVVKYKDFDHVYLENFYQKASSRWIRHKLTQPKWIFRQAYYFYRCLKGQGYLACLNKLIRLIKLTFLNGY